MIEMRNLSSHVYDEEENRVMMLGEGERFRQALEDLKSYLEEHLENDVA